MRVRVCMCQLPRRFLVLFLSFMVLSVLGLFVSTEDDLPSEILLGKTLGAMSARR